MKVAHCLMALAYRPMCPHLKNFALKLKDENIFYVYVFLHLHFKAVCLPV